MSYNGAGTWTANSTGLPVVTSTVISTTMFNAFTTDVATGLSTAMLKDGTQTPTANLSMHGFKITGLGNPTTAGDALIWGGPMSVALTGVLKGNGSSAITAATAGTDYVAPGTATNFTAKQTFSGAAGNAALKLVNALEKFPSSATAATGTINYDISTQSALRYSSYAAANWTVNFRGDGSNTLDSLMAVDESVSVTFAVKQGSPAFYNNAVTIDSGAVTPVWQGGAPTAGNTNGYDVYTYVIQKTAAATFFVLASLVTFV